MTSGVVALGDSISYGHGGMQTGLGSQSWAQWLAEAMELPFTRLAVNGATAPDVLRGQLPRLERSGRRYDVATVYVGVNDVRDFGWDPAAYVRDLDAILAGVAAHAGDDLPVLGERRERQAQRLGQPQRPRLRAQPGLHPAVPDGDRVAEGEDAQPAGAQATAAS